MCSLNSSLELNHIQPICFDFSSKYGSNPKIQMFPELVGNIAGRLYILLPRFPVGFLSSQWWVDMCMCFYKYVY